jgi:hypothetical protein
MEPQLGLRGGPIMSSPSRDDEEGADLIRRHGGSWIKSKSYSSYKLGGRGHYWQIRVLMLGFFISLHILPVQLVHYCNI